MPKITEGLNGGSCAESSAAQACSPLRLLPLRSAVVVCLITIAPRLGLAQESTPSAEATADTLQEVVVTAEHMAENVQHTPIAISVYSGDALKMAGITDMAALTAVAPDVSFTTTEGQSVITIRGISSRDTTENGDPAVTVNTDGFYMNRPYGLNANLYDIDRIEVLRGPQGTLNGRNSVGGAINVITAKPGDDFTAYTSLQYGDYNDLELQGMVNLPLTEQVQIRTAFLSASHDGYRNNAPQPPGDSQDDKSARIELAFEPMEHLTGLLTAQYTTQGGSGDVTQYIPFIYTGTGALNHNLPPGINSSTFPLGTDPFLRLRDEQYRANLLYDFDKVEVTALAGYDNTSFAQGIDQTLYPNAPTGVYQWTPTQNPDTVNAEIRIASRGSGPFQWQVGGFYFNESSSLLGGDVSQGADGGYNEYFGFVYHTSQSSKAGYAQASYQLTPQLKLTGGFRYTADYKEEYGYYGDVTAGIVYANESGSASFSKSTYQVAADYDLNSTSMLYAKLDTGYKAGGFNFGGSAYAPETVKAYEVGSKNRFLDNTLQLNVALFYDDYTDQQVANYAFLPTGQPVQLTQNAGASHNYGAETEVLYKIPVIGTLNFSADYLHARYTYFLSVADPSDPKASGNVQLAGNQPPQAPAWSFGMGLEQSWALPGGSLTGRIQSKAQTSYYFSFYNFADTREKGYTMSDAFLTYKPGVGKWKLTAFVRNIENSVVFKDAEESEYSSAYAYEFYPPRTYGGRLEYSW
jgi:iron complex outermembrane receptor protein